MKISNEISASLRISTPRRILNVAISLVFLLVSEALRKLGALFGKKQCGFTTGIFYHHVRDDERVRFAKQMDHLRRWAEPINIDAAFQRAQVRNRVFVSADDGWISFVKNALPEMRERQIPAAIFVISGEMSKNLGVTGDRIVTRDEVRELSRTGVYIGSHTHSHARLTTLSANDLTSELVKSRDILSQTIGKPIDMLCFPFGSYDQQVAEKCKEAGYVRVFASIPRFKTISGDDFIVNRIRVDPWEWMIEYHLKIMGAYRWVELAIIAKRWLARPLKAFHSAGRDAPLAEELEESLMPAPHTD